jgi:hypothetical protein
MERMIEPERRLVLLLQDPARWTDFETSLNSMVSAKDHLAEISSHLSSVLRLPESYDLGGLEQWLASHGVDGAGRKWTASFIDSSVGNGIVSKSSFSVPNECCNK